MPDFSKLLSTKVDNIEKPKPTPVGTWTFLVKGHRFDESGQKKTPFVEFQLTPMVPQDDVDQEQLANAGGLEKIKDREMRATFYLTEDALWRLREFLEVHLGLNCSGRSLSEVIPEANNQSVNGYVEHVLNQKNNETYANIKSFAKV